MNLAPRRKTAVLFLLLAVATAAVYRPLLAGGALAGRDLFRLFIPDADFLLQTLRAGELPLWLPYARLGQPFAATLQAQAFYPPRLLAVLLAGPVWGVTLEHLLHVAIAVAGTALAARRLGASRTASTLAGAAFALGPLFTQLNPQQNVACAVAWSGFVLTAAVDAARRPAAGSVSRLALAFALSFLAGSPETVLWQIFAAAAFAAGVANDRWRAATAFGAGGVWALLLCAFAALPAVELARESQPLGPDDLLAWSAAPADLASLFWPAANWPLDTSGDGQAFVLTLFQGAWLTVFALVGLGSRAKRRRLLPLALVALLLALLSLGRHLALAEAVLELVPFRFFRYPVKYAIGAAFLVTLLAAPGLDRTAALARRWRPRPGRVLTGALVLAGLGALAGFAAGTLGMRPGATAGAFWLGATLVAGWCALSLAPGRADVRGRRARAVAIALVVLEAAAMHAASGPPFTVPSSRLEQHSRLASLLADGSRLSTGSETIGESRTPDGISLADWVASSRDALAGKRFVEERLSSIDGYEAPRPRRLLRALREAPRGLFDLAGVGWFLRRGQSPFPGLETEFASSDLALPSVYRSRTALPRAFVVHRAEAVDEERAFKALRDHGQPFRHTAFLELSEGESLPPLHDCGRSEARIVDARANSLEVEVRSCGPGLLVVTDSWVPGWKAWVGAAEMPVLRADYLVRAVPVPAGDHRVALRYRPESFRVGVAASALAWAALLVIALRARLSKPACGHPRD